MSYLYLLLLRSHAPLSGGSNASTEGAEQILPHQVEKGRGFFCPFPKVSITQGEGIQPPSLLSPPGLGSVRLCNAMLMISLPHPAS
jgi:hypothetical protein